MTHTRRNFLKTSAGAAAFAVAPPLLVNLTGHASKRSHEPPPPVEDPKLKELIQRGIDAARRAGAQYTDIRLTYTRWRYAFPGSFHDYELLGAGVRTLVNGYWGFASSPVWSPEEIVRLSTQAVRHSKINALGKSRPIELAPVSTVRDGHWDMPVRLNPFEIHPSEVSDMLVGLDLYLLRTPGAKSRGNEVRFFMQERALGSSDNSYCTQRVFRVGGVFGFRIEDTRNNTEGYGELDTLTPAGVGWELYRDQPLHDQLRKEIEEVQADMKLPAIPVDVGRYDTLIDANSAARIVSSTIGDATQLDRALGYEANAGGTSYINDPAEMLGTFKIGAPSMTVTANRSEPGGAATIKWDDECVSPQDFTVVKDGILSNLSTTRESAGWLKPYYTSAKIPFQSSGSAYAPSGIDLPLSHTPNLAVRPGTESGGFEELLSNMQKGIAFRRTRCNIDFQQLNGLAFGKAYEIKKGKRNAIMWNAGLLFRAPELWKSIIALGGPNSVERFGQEVNKGEPPQYSYHSVSAVPVIAKDATVVDILRKA